MQGFPQAGPTWQEFLQKQQGVLRTADKVERELKSVLRFNPESLVAGVQFEVSSALNSIANLLLAVENIKHTAAFAVDELPVKVRNFTEMVETYLGESSDKSRRAAAL